MKFIQIFLLMAVCVYFVKAQNYCDKNLCKRGVHIGCYNDHKFSSNCSPGTTVVNMIPLIDTILKKHNKIRNIVASGNFSSFKSAERMPTLVWNIELAQLAEMYVKKCILNHSRCHNTNKFKYSGQNSARLRIHSAVTPKDAIIIVIDAWIRGNTNCYPSDIDKYERSTRKQIKQFTVIVSDRNTELGCAMIRSTYEDKFEYLIACNYATTNLIGYPIYKTGRAASACKTRNNIKYPALCSPLENVNANDL